MSRDGQIIGMMGLRHVLTLLAVTASVVTPATSLGSVTHVSGCRESGGERTTVIIDGELYGMIRAPGPRYLFGWSGKPVLTIGEALGLLRKLGLEGTDRQLLRLLANGREIPGSAYVDAGSIAYFSLRCRGTYTVRVVVRGGRLLPATRIWLHEERQRVVRSFCMGEQWLRNGARLSVTFRVPLATAPPAFAVDGNADGRIDRVGRFRQGGEAFPVRVSC